jgi:Zn finger protein HypA/HybF involved in hydrogenase expression
MAERDPFDDVAFITPADAAKLLGVELSDPPGPLERLEETIDQLSIDLDAFTDEQLEALGPAERRLITETRQHIREYELAKERPSITCPRCSLTSYHPKDISERYCGRCHAWHDDIGKGDG